MENHLLTILLVDDHKVLRTSIRNLLLSEFPKVLKIVEATDGREALKILKNQKFDLLITDELMKQMSGHELIQKLEESQIKLGEAIYLVTALDDKGEFADEVPDIEIINKTEIIGILLPRIKQHVESVIGIPA